MTQEACATIKECQVSPTLLLLLSSSCLFLFVSFAPLVSPSISFLCTLFEFLSPHFFFLLSTPFLSLFLASSALIFALLVRGSPDARARREQDRGQSGETYQVRAAFDLTVTKTSYSVTVNRSVLSARVLGGGLRGQGLTWGVVGPVVRAAQQLRGAERVHLPGGHVPAPQLSSGFRVFFSLAGLGFQRDE